MPDNLRTAKVGPLKFPGDFPVPAVDVTRSANITEHQTVNNNNVVQIMGENLPKITIDGVIYEPQLEDVDKIVGGPEVKIFTYRWTGMGVVEAVDTTFRREADPETGSWCYDIQIDVLGTKDHIVEEKGTDGAQSGQ